MTKVKLIGYLDIPHERRNSIFVALSEHITLTRAEDGCITFEVTESDTIVGRLNVNELFTDQAAFDFHQSRTKNSAWAKTTDGIPRHYTISTEP
tara:strand:+ start:1261 stop:1542 length:282 start_codon:yes stop_codon:yes gene_type:complete